MDILFAFAYFIGGLLAVVIWWVIGYGIFVYFQEKYGGQPVDDLDPIIPALVCFFGPFVYLLAQDVFKEKIAKEKRNKQ